MPNSTAELPDVDHFLPVQIVEIKAVQTRGGKLRISRDLVEMAARAKKDDDYQELIRKVTTGVNFENLEEDDPHKVYKDKWQDLRILATIAGDLVYANNCLVPPLSERPNLITQSHQSHLNFESIYATQRKFWWWPEMRAQIKAEWQQCPDCTRGKKSKTTLPPFSQLRRCPSRSVSCGPLTYLNLKAKTTY